MTISSVSSATALTQLYQGLSSDTKPTVGVQSFARFMETDTASEYIYTGSEWRKITAGGASVVAPSDGRVTETHSRYYSGDPGTTTRIRWFDHGVDRVTVYVEAVEPRTDASAQQAAAVRVALNLTTDMGDVALADRDPGETGELPYYVATVKEPLVLDYDTQYDKIWNVVFIEDNTTAIAGVRIVGEGDIG